MANGHGGRREGAGSGGKRPRACPRHAATRVQRRLLVNITHDSETDAVRVMAADKVIDRAMGKAPQHIDVTAMRHTDIVYHSAEELRQEFRRQMEEAGVPKALMDLTAEELDLSEPEPEKTD